MKVHKADKSFPEGWVRGTRYREGEFQTFSAFPVSSPSHQTDLEGINHIITLRIAIAECFSFFFFSESCQVPSEVYGITRECYGEYFISKDDKYDYNVGWQNVTEYHKRIRWDDMMWRYQNASVLHGYPVWARLNTYSGGGYVPLIYCNPYVLCLPL